MTRHLRTFDTTPDELVAEWPAAVQELAGRVRAAIHAGAFGLVESVYPVWRGLSYQHLVTGHVCDVFPLDGGLVVTFGARRFEIGVGDEVPTEHLHGHIAATTGLRESA